KLGMYIGIGGVVTFKNARKAVEVVQEIPLERIVLETDCPYLSPVPYRGKRNDSGMIKYVAEKIAEIKHISVEEVLAVTLENAKKVYMI
ncbi:MAG: TatD family hydrolase, partial [Clostridia bacterium]|nr:TatD family hydrolase [Clostridia bacterium]